MLSFFFSSRRRHTRLQGDWSSDVCSSDLEGAASLMDAVEKSLVGPRVLTEPTVRDRLRAAKVKELDGRIAKLTATLTPGDVELDKAIAARRRGFDAAKVDVEWGAAVCAARRGER